MFLDEDKALLALKDFLSHFSTLKFEEVALGKMGKMLSKTAVCALKLRSLGLAHE